MQLIEATKRITATVLIFTFTLSYSPFSFAAMEIDPALNSTTKTADPFTSSGSSDSSANPETNLAEAGPLSAVASEPVAQSVNKTTFLNGLTASLPNYKVETVPYSDHEELTITYSGTTALPTKAFQSLKVNISETPEGKIHLDMDSLILSYKDKIITSAENPILEDRVNALREIGLVVTPSIDANTVGVTDNFDDLKTLLSLTKINVNSTTSKGTGSNPARTIVFSSLGFEYTITHKENSLTNTLTAKTIDASLKYLFELRSAIGNDYQVNVESYTGKILNVVVSPIAPVTTVGAVTQIKFSLSGTTIVAKSLNIFVKTAAGQEPVPTKTIEMAYDGALIVSANSSSNALIHLAHAQNLSTTFVGTAKSPITYYQTVNQGEVKNYRVSYKGKTIVIENMTNETEIRDFLSTTLQNHLGNDFKVELVSISPLGLYDVKVSSVLTTIPTGAFSSMTFKLDRVGGQIVVLANSLVATYKGIAANTSMGPALLASFGISEPGQSPEELVAIIDLDLQLTALTQIKILSAFDSKTKKIAFNYSNRDYRTTYEPGVVPFVGNATMDFLFESLTKQFSGASVSKTPAQDPNTGEISLTEFSFSIIDKTTKNGELMTISFHADLNNATANSSGDFSLTPTEFQVSYKTAAGERVITGDDATILREGITGIANKPGFVENLVALRSTTFESLNNSIFSVLYNKNRYDVLLENDHGVAKQVFPVKPLTASTFKALDPLVDFALKTTPAAINTEVTVLRSELLKTGGNVLTSTDRDGSIYIEFFSNANGTYTTIKIENDPRNNQKTIVTSSLPAPITTLTPTQAQFYLQNMVTEASTTANAADIKAMLVTTPIPTLTLQQINGLSILTGTYKTNDPVSMVIYPDQTLKIFSASKTATAMPTLAVGVTAAATALDIMDNYYGKLDLSTLADLEGLRTQIKAGAVKFINVEKNADGSYQFTWFTDRSGSAKSIKLSTAVVGGKVVFGGLTVSTSAPLVSEQTTPEQKKGLINYINLYLKNYSTATAAAITTHLNKLRGSTSATATPTSLITVSFVNGGVILSAASPSYTIQVSATGVVS